MNYKMFLEVLEVVEIKIYKIVQILEIERLYRLKVNQLIWILENDFINYKLYKYINR